MAEPILAAKDVRKVFGTGAVATEIIHGINVRFDEGEFTAIIGPSGSGKSTLLYMLGALERPTSGAIFIAGQDIAHLSDLELAHLRNSTLGFVFQFHFLLPEFSSRENVAMPLLIHGGVSAIEAMKRADDMLARVGLGDKVQARPGEMSGGQMQRVAIARALINQPRIIFCDEPTGSLDTQSSEQVYHLLRELNSEFHQTIIVVTHETNFADRSDRVITIVDGCVEQDERRNSGE
ncbi:MAG TPA: ABC transporter ATP-binding protein [Armatimonadota bacterium]|nr:ABC transporter ATP-binding protein [Armatimonadota bacterium]